MSKWEFDINVQLTSKWHKKVTQMAGNEDNNSINFMRI